MRAQVERRSDGGWPLDAVPPHSGPAGLTWPRRPWSVRRTSTIDTVWPEGLGTELQMTGRGRDLLTGADPAYPRVLVEDRCRASVSPAREILALETTPPRPGAGGLVGSRAGSQLRSAIAECLPADLASGSPLYLLLDDIAGASLVANWAWSLWQAGWLERVRSGAEQAGASERNMVGVCVGFSPQSPVVAEGLALQQNLNQQVVDLAANGDPFGWHELARQDGPSARRSRLIDVWFDGPVIKARTHFQDSGPTPHGTRMAVHEYLVAITVDRASMTLVDIDADPRILPFGYCPAATLNIRNLVGTPVADLRRQVLAEFPKTLGCTHLNDTMRSFAEVPLLIGQLEDAMAVAEVG